MKGNGSRQQVELNCGASCCKGLQALINILLELKRGPDALMDCGLLCAKIRHLPQEVQSQTLQEAKTVFGLGEEGFGCGEEKEELWAFTTQTAIPRFFFRERLHLDFCSLCSIALACRLLLHQEDTKNQVIWHPFTSCVSKQHGNTLLRHKLLSFVLGSALYHRHGGWREKQWHLGQYLFSSAGTVSHRRLCSLSPDFHLGFYILSPRVAERTCLSVCRSSP